MIKLSDAWHLGQVREFVPIRLGGGSAIEPLDGEIESLPDNP